MPAGNPGGYGNLTLNAMGGVGGARKPGQKFTTPTMGGARMNPAAMQQARQSAVASSSGMRLDPTRIMGTPQRAVSARPNPGSARQYARKAPMPAGAGNSPVSQVVKQADNAGQKSLLKGKGKGLAIGAGAAVIAGLAYSGRRGEGSSGGRTGMTRY
jgi:hypothetical protein